MKGVRNKLRKSKINNLIQGFIERANSVVEYVRSRRASAISVSFQNNER